MKKILITGGTGLIGKHLTKLLLFGGYDVAILSRNPKEKNEFRWNIPEQFVDEKAFENITHIIHLAGAGIADKRWSNSRKKVLIDSRVQSANLLFKKCKELQLSLQGFISASGIGYYGAITSNTIFSENDAPKNDFISNICVQWENSAKKFEKLNTPVTILRTGIVLASRGALQKMNTPLFLSVLGTGNQYMPWIHIYDLCNLYIKAIENNSFSGIFNAVSPDFQNNKSFTKTLGKVIKKPISPINIPAFILKLILGEMSEILLKGSRVSSKKTEAEYSFLFHQLDKALANIYHTGTLENSI